MNKKDALVIQILAQKSSRDSTKNRITAPENMYKALRKQYEDAEKALKNTRVTVSAQGGRGTHKAVTWQPGIGLCVHDYGPGDFPHWKDVPDGVLLTVVSLLPNLLDQAHKTNTENKSKDLEKGARAVTEGVSLPLFPAPAPVTRPVNEEDMKIEDPIVPEEEDEDAIEDDEEEEEEEEDDDEIDGEEIVGTPGALELDNSPQVVLENLLPPAAVILEPEAKKSRRGRKK